MKEKLYAVLRTKRLVLRPITKDDTELLWHDMSDPEISKYMAWETHIEKTETSNFLSWEETRRETGKGATWGIFKDDEFCGIVSLIALLGSHRAITYNKAELAYWLGRKHQGQGIMTEAVYQVMQLGYRELGLHKICVSHFSVNTASEKLIKRLGFRYIGEQLEEFQKNSIWYNQKNYELIDKEFYQLNAKSLLEINK